ncbi:hypothetical protein L5515_005560 [Caenorhabditis briggsae]|uniref:Uncharacterized protein n=1 Tax=Caenorhabditis briggsae TaxID=6238 RepID=A0AAE9EPM6_CAEBR|nr:hypothetical protein L5515_005560 [Caenorhabditis briggsae]
MTENQYDPIDEVSIDDQFKQIIQNITQKFKFGAENEKKTKTTLREWIAKTWNSIKKQFWEILRYFWNFIENQYWEILHYFLNGGAVGVFYNSLHWIIRIGGTAKANIVTVLDATRLNSLENPTWFARVDAPHGNVPFHHINVNPSYTGHPDPHIQISPFSAEIAEHLGVGLEVVNKISPYLLTFKIAVDVGVIGYNVYKDWKRGSTRNTVKAVTTILSSTAGGFGGIFPGSAIGSLIFPGIGTLVGGFIGGVCGAIGAGIVSDLVFEKFSDDFKYDIDEVTCKKCDKEFESRRYELGEQEMCEECRPQDEPEEKSIIENVIGFVVEKFTEVKNVVVNVVANAVNWFKSWF